MNIKTPFKIAGLLVLGLLFANASFGQTIYSQSTTNLFATGTNLIEVSASTLTAATFRSDVAIAWTNDLGGVFDLPTAVVTGTTVFRGGYGKNIPKRMQMTSSVSMQNSTAGGGTIYPISGANVATTSANQSDFNMTLGLFDPTSGLPLSGVAINEIGFVILSRVSANYPLDVLCTASFTDGTTQAFRASISNVRGADDTFYGFTAPVGQGITNIHFQSFQTGTTNLIADRIVWDDFGFVTGTYTALSQPLIINVSPAAYAILNPTNTIQFNALTYAVASTNNISLILNSNDVSSQLAFSGNPTNYLVTYTGSLLPNQTYTFVINVTNAAGAVSVTNTFYTITNTTVLFDSGGFSDPVLYPVGNLTAVTNGQAYWIPNTNEPAQIVNVGDPQDNVLERQNTGATRADYLIFPPVSSGIVTIDFDAYVSIVSGRTLDVGLSPTVGSSMASFLSWGQVASELSYYDNTNWIPIAPISAATWHHITIINYLSGSAGGTYDVLLNGSPVTQKTHWRNSTNGSAFNTLRIESVNTSPLFEYGYVDNLVVTMGPENPLAVPPPALTNILPFAYAISKPANGIQFNVVSQLSMGASNVFLILNSNDVSSQLVLSGSGTNLMVSYSNLLANQIYTMLITASNAAAMVSYTNTFYTYTNDVVLYDSGGFTDDTLYPLGPLLAVTNGLGYWVPCTTPAQIVNNGDPVHGKVLERSQVGNELVDDLKFTPIASGTIVYSFDVHVSDPVSRTVDFSLQNDGAVMSSFIILATNAVNYVLPGGALVPTVGLDTNWHHYSIVNYLSGSTSNKYDLSVDGTLVGSGLAWRSATLAAAVTPLDEIRVGAIRGTLGAYGDVDNFVVTAGPERTSVLRVLLTSPVVTPTTFQFSFLSQSSVTYAAQYKTNILSTNWTTFQTIVGDGTSKTVTHTNATTSALFYRVKTQ